MKPQSQRRDLTQGDIVAHILRMSIPMVIGIGSIISFSIADSYFISLLGTKELAAISYTIPITTLFFNIIFGMAIAMSAVVSKKAGAGLFEEIKETASVGIFIAVLLSACLSMIGYIFQDAIFMSLGANGEVLEIIKEYMPLWFIAAIFLSIPLVANSAIRGMGDTFWPAAVMVTAAVLNIILDPILIFGLLGSPEMGVKGAAVATLIAYVGSAMVAIWILAVREGMFGFMYCFALSSWKKCSKPLLVIALPVALGSIIAPILTYIYVALLSDYGHYAVAGYGVASRLEAFALIPIMAVAGGMAPLIGQNFGANRYDRVRETLGIAFKFSILYGLGCAIILGVSAKFLAHIFSPDPQIYDFIYTYLLFVPISFIGLNVFAVITSAMNAMGNARVSLALNILKSFIIAVPAAYFMLKYNGINGFYFAIILTNFAGLAIAYYNLKSQDCFKIAKQLR